MPPRHQIAAPSDRRAIAHARVLARSEVAAAALVITPPRCSTRSSASERALTRRRQHSEREGDDGF